MKWTRRSFLASTAITGGAAALFGPSAWRSSSAAERRALPIPELLDARSQQHALSLTVQAGRRAFFAGRESATLGYNQSYLGPTLRVHRGDDVEVSVTNALREPTTVHWHGLLIPGELDGGPHQTIRPDATWRPVLPIRQPPATLWYHSHVHGRTAEQVYAGLAGLLIVTDEEERALNLPSEYGVDDLPLILQDRQFQNGSLVLPQGMMTAMHGRRADTLLVNGTPSPIARVPRQLVRLRLVNGSNARAYETAFSDGRSFHWIASEGGLLEQPVELQSLRLIPGERAEILVDFSDGRPVDLETGADPTAPMMMGMLARASNLVGVGRASLVSFEPEGRSETQNPIPNRLAKPDRASPSDAMRRRHFSLDMGMGMMGRGAGTFGINGRAFAMDRVDEEVRIGDTEIWDVVGNMMAHPFHVHGVHFEVLSRNGDKPMQRDQGLKDTVLIDDPVELLVRFTKPAQSAPFMYHCHILEHEDNGMMGQFTVS